MSNPAAASIYARISSDQDGTALGVTRQLADCRELAARLGWTVAEEYVDNDLSAFSGKRRPAYEQMVADIADGHRDAVLVYHVDRLTRRPIELEQFVDTVTAAKVRHVRFVSGADVDIANGDGLMVLRMMAAVAANESASKSRRVKRKLDEVAAAGMPHGGSRRPFGFEPDKITHRPDEANVIRDVTARFLAGESLMSLVRWMDAEGIKSVFDKPWRTGTLRDMMTAPRTAGIREHAGSIIGKAVWEPIITPEDRNRVLSLIAQRRVTRERTPRSYLLTGMLKCSRCHHTLYSSRRVDVRRYVCSSSPDHGGCGRMTIDAPGVEELVQNAVLYRLDSPELAEALAGRINQDDATASLSDHLAGDQLMLNDLAQMYAAREITRSEWMTARKPVESRITEIERRLSRMTRTDALAGIVGNGAALGQQWASLNLTRQHAIVKAVLDHIVISPADRRGPRVVDPSRVDLVWRI
jgi:site-specific DNA recombinase